jgi:hypothetical protein
MHEYELRKIRKINKSNTIRHYPQRDKYVKNNTYSVRVFENQKYLDKYLTVYLSKDTKSQKIGNYIENEEKNILFDRVKYISNFANDIYNKKIDGFNLEHLAKTYDVSRRDNMTYFDMSYQELANFLNCKVIVNENLCVDFSVTIGHTDDEKYIGSGFGRVDEINYSQRGHSNQIQKGDPKNLTYYLPVINEENEKNDISEKSEIVKSNEYIVMITPPLKKVDYQLSTQMKPAYSINDICKHCWLSYGRIWMLKGSGHKSLKKNKGMKKWRNIIEI